MIPRFLFRSIDKLLPPSPAHPTAITGQRGEDEAFFYLRGNGYTVVARNFRVPSLRGELDIVAWEGKTLCFVEVKTRTEHHEEWTAEAAVNAEKRDDLRRIAKAFLRKLKAEPPVRFDIVSVYFAGPKPEVTLFKNAFPMA